jgi:hypothetical protein
VTITKQIPFTEEIKNVYTVFVRNILALGIPGHRGDFNIQKDLSGTV